MTLQFDVLKGFGDFEGKLRHPDAVDVADLEPILKTYFRHCEGTNKARALAPGKVFLAYSCIFR